VAIRLRLRSPGKAILRLSSYVRQLLRTFRVPVVEHRVPTESSKAGVGYNLAFAGGGISSRQNLAGRVARMRPFLFCWRAAERPASGPRLQDEGTTNERGRRLTRPYFFKISLVNSVRYCSHQLRRRTIIRSSICTEGIGMEPPIESGSSLPKLHSPITNYQISTH